MQSLIKPTRITSYPSGKKFPKELLASSYELFVEVLRWKMGNGNSPFPDYKHYIFKQMDWSSRPESNCYRTLIMEPRSHAKTTCDIIPYAPWRWLSDPSLRVGVWSQGESQAKKIVKGIINIVTKYFPEYYTVEYSKKQEMQLKHHKMHQIDPSLECFPILGNSSVGSGKDLIILDDVYTQLNADTETKARKIKENVEDLEDLFRESPHPQIMVVGTRLNEDDIYADMINDELQTKSLIFPMVPYEHRDKFPERIQTLEEAQELKQYTIWPTILPLQKFISRWNNKRTRFSQYLLEPASTAERVFDMSCVVFEPTRFNVNNFERYVIMLDPAEGETAGKRSDDFAIVVMGFDSQGKWHVVDGWASNEYSQEEMLEEWIKLVQKWRKTGRGNRTQYPMSYYEKTGVGAGLPMPMRTVINSKNWIGNKPVFKEYKPGGIKKEIRIETMLSSLVSNELLVIHQSPISDKLIEQMTKFSTARAASNKVDVIDAAAAGVAKLCAISPSWAKRLAELDDNFLDILKRLN